jgi:hypothetical protein
MHLHARGRIDPEFDVIALHFHDGDLDVVTDPDVLSELSGEEEHRALVSPASCRAMFG